MKQKDNKETVMASYAMLVPVAILLWRWYSHVWLPHVLGWWLCLLIALIQAMCVAWAGNLVRIVFVIILIASFVAQVLSWGGAIQLPIIK